MFGKKKNDDAKPADGKTFLAEARQAHSSLYEEYAEGGEESYDSLGALLTDLEQDVWQRVVEPLVKKSYANGVRKGRSQRRAS